VLCKHEVTGSIPVASTSLRPYGAANGKPAGEAGRVGAKAREPVQGGEGQRRGMGSIPGPWVSRRDARLG
jgi:hypothetical protein